MAASRPSCSASRSNLFSPYEFNPLDINSLRERGPMPVLIAATRVGTGQGRIFREHELTAEVVLASACLPQLHHAVEIDGEAYWDGGYSSNPPVLELAELGLSPTLLVLRINPADGEGLPLYRSTVVRHRFALMRPWVSGRSDRLGPAQASCSRAAR